MKLIKKSQTEELKEKLATKAMKLEPGSEELDKVLEEIKALDSVHEKDGVAKYVGFGLTFLGTVAVPITLTVMNNHYKTKWTKAVCQWEKDETFRTSAGRQVSGLFKF